MKLLIDGNGWWEIFNKGSNRILKLYNFFPFTWHCLFRNFNYTISRNLLELQRWFLLCLLWLLKNKIFMPRRFYVKSNLAILVSQKLPFWRFFSDTFKCGIFSKIKIRDSQMAKIIVFEPKYWWYWCKSIIYHLVWGSLDLYIEIKMHFYHVIELKINLLHITDFTKQIKHDF